MAQCNCAVARLWLVPVASGALMIPHIPRTLHQRIHIFRLHTSGNLIVTLLNRDGSWRHAPFLVANLDTATHAMPDLTQPTRGTK